MRIKSFKRTSLLSPLACGGLTVAALVLAGCAQVAPAPAEPDPSRAIIAGSLAKVTQERADTRSADAAARAHSARLSGQGGTISVSFAGDAKVLLKQVAAARGIKYSVRGPEPRLPLFVVIDADNITIHELYSDIGNQMGQRADLVLKNDGIEVRYRDFN